MVLDRYAPVKTSLLAGLNGRKHVGIKSMNQREFTA